MQNNFKIQILHMNRILIEEYFLHFDSVLLAREFAKSIATEKNIFTVTQISHNGKTKI